MEDKIYVSGLWLIDANYKRSRSHYMDFLNKTLVFAKNSTLVFYHNDKEIAGILKEIARSNKINLRLIEMNLSELPANKFLETNSSIPVDLSPFKKFWHDRNIEKEKCFEHFFVDSNNGEDFGAFQQMRKIWISKIFLVLNVVNSFKAKEYIWMDASVSRFNKTRRNWDFNKVKIKGDRIYHYSSIMNFFGKNLPLNASLLKGSKDAWLQLFEIYCEFLQKTSKASYLFDEEIVLAMCYKHNPTFFNCINRERRTLLHRVAGKILFPINGFVLKSINYNNNLIYED